MIDLSFLEKFTKGDAGKMKRYITMYLTVAPKTLQAMELDIQNQDWKQLQINAHSLKPQSDYMGIDALKAVLVEIENGVQNKSYNTLEPLYQKALGIYQESEFLLNARVNEL